MNSVSGLLLSSSMPDSPSQPGSPSSPSRKEQRGKEEEGGRRDSIAPPSTMKLQAKVKKGLRKFQAVAHSTAAATALLRQAEVLGGRNKRDGNIRFEGFSPGYALHKTPVSLGFKISTTDEKEEDGAGGGGSRGGKTAQRDMENVRKRILALRSMISAPSSSHSTIRKKEQGEGKKDRKEEGGGFKSSSVEKGGGKGKEEEGERRRVETAMPGLRKKSQSFVGGSAELLPSTERQESRRNTIGIADLSSIATDRLRIQPHPPSTPRIRRRGSGRPGSRGETGESEEEDLRNNQDEEGMTLMPRDSSPLLLPTRRLKRIQAGGGENYEEEEEEEDGRSERRGGRSKGEETASFGISRFSTELDGGEWQPRSPLVRMRVKMTKTTGGRDPSVSTFSYSSRPTTSSSSSPRAPAVRAGIIDSRPGFGGRKVRQVIPVNIAGRPAPGQKKHVS